MSGAHRTSDAGFTLAEVLTTTAILTIGLLATALAFQYAISGIEAGRGETTAALLAEQKLEALKALALVDWTHTTLSSGQRTEFCHAAGDCTTTAAPGTYRRETTLIDNPGGPCTAACKLVQVTVFYQALSADGRLQAQRRIDVLTLLVART
jgi:prepilin-type N-terminal cleavage/methylation domain-containing protein